MEEFLKIVEEPLSTEVAIDADRLKFFNSKLKYEIMLKFRWVSFKNFHLKTHSKIHILQYSKKVLC